MTSRMLQVFGSAVLCVALLTPTISEAATSSASPSLQVDGSSDVDAAILEASVRFGVPASWVRAVIQLESHGAANAVSPKGALGLMQLMPKTYDEMRQRLSLGADPFSVHDNVMAGTAYLRDMLDRYGVVGMLGAYNSGPVRWEQHLAGARPLPAETVGYLTALGPLLSSELTRDTVAVVEPRPSTPAEASLFVTATARRGAIGAPSDRQAIVGVITANPTVIPQNIAGPPRAPVVDQRGRRKQSTPDPDRTSTTPDSTGEALFIKPTQAGALRGVRESPGIAQRAMEHRWYAGRDM